MAAASGATDASPDHVQLLVKNPTDQPGEPPFSLSAALDSTVACLKADIAASYPGRPSVDRQRIIFSGKLLADVDTLSTVLAGFDATVPQTFHLVISGSSPSDPSTSASTHLSITAHDSHAPASGGSAGPTGAAASAGPSFAGSRFPPRSQSTAATATVAAVDVSEVASATAAQESSIVYQNPGPTAAYYATPGGYFDPTRQIPLPPSDHGAPPAPPNPSPPYIAPPMYPGSANYPGMPPQYGNFTVDSAYVAHLEAMQQRFAQEIAQHQFARNPEILFPQAPANRGPPMPQPEHNHHPNQHPYDRHPHPHHPQQPLPYFPQPHLGPNQQQDPVGARFEFEFQGRAGDVRGEAGDAGANGDRRAAGQNARPWARQYVFQIELNWALISKLILLVVLLGQEASSQRVSVLFGAAVVIYLWQTGRVGLLHRLAARLLPTPTQLFAIVAPPVTPASPAEDAGQGVTDNSVSSANPREHVERRVISRIAVLLSYAYSFLYGFVCSLLPSWEPVELPSMSDLLRLTPVVPEAVAEERGVAAAPGAASVDVVRAVNANPNRDE
jgi:Ubiquitin family